MLFLCHQHKLSHTCVFVCVSVPLPNSLHSANILLSQDWSAALGDYGVLRIQPSAGTMMTTTVAGTPEYMDPEYIKGGVISEKTDIYSFGVVGALS